MVVKDLWELDQVQGVFGRGVTVFWPWCGRYLAAVQFCVVDQVQRVWLWGTCGAWWLDQVQGVEWYHVQKVAGPGPGGKNGTTSKKWLDQVREGPGPGPLCIGGGT